MSGPWMVQFYGNKMNRKHLEMGPLMQRCIDYLESVNEDPSVILKGMADVTLQHQHNLGAVKASSLESPGLYPLSIKPISGMEIIDCPPVKVKMEPDK